MWISSAGHRELTACTGAEIVFGEKAGAAFAHRAVKEARRAEHWSGDVAHHGKRLPAIRLKVFAFLVVDTEILDDPQKF